MGITISDINAQRAMLKRGDAIREASKQREDRKRLHDTFAAAALTGLLADQSLGDLEDITLATRAFELASAMVEERDRISGFLPPTLTDEEREAVATAVVYLKEDDDFPGVAKDRATLRNLLERLHT
jgi:hypothetical protein